MADIGAAAREVIVHAEHLGAHAQKALTEERTQKARATGDQYAFGDKFISHA